jgi:hypothetical protein
MCTCRGSRVVVFVLFAQLTITEISVYMSIYLAIVLVVFNVYMLEGIT